MSTLLAEPIVRPSPPPSQRLRSTTAAARVSLRWLDTRKTSTTDQKALAADACRVAGGLLSAGKKLLATKHRAFKGVTTIKGRILSYWKRMSLPYPEPGIRLIHRDEVDVFDARMHKFEVELEEAVWRLDEHYTELKSAARQRQGRLYNPGDYPESLGGLFQVSWNFPSIEPAGYLQELHPDLYRQECARVADCFRQAVSLAEQAFLEELQPLVARLSERLTSQSDGKPAAFRDSAVTNLTEFCERFQRLNVGSNEDLDRLVERCQGMIRGVEPQLLRDNQGLRQQVIAELGQAQSVLDTLWVDRSRRNIRDEPPGCQRGV